MNFSHTETIIENEPIQHSPDHSDADISNGVKEPDWHNYFLPRLNTSLDYGHIKAEDLADKIKNHDGSEAHHCVFDLEPRTNFKDYSGRVRPALGLVFFDFDSKEDKGETALEDIRRFCTWLEVADYALFYSGSKGFVVGVPEGYVGLPPTTDLPAKLTFLAKTLKSQFPTLDTGLYSANHKLRAFGTRHPVSGHYRVQLMGELKTKIINGFTKMDEIRKLASVGRGELSLDYLELSKKREPLRSILEIMKPCDTQDTDESAEYRDSGQTYSVDSEAVKTGCEFLKFVRLNPNSINESQWYAALSILGRLYNGRTEAHEYSKDYKGYSISETDAKLEQALKSSKPRTCKNINTVWGKCEGCPNFEKVSSPISIRRPEFISTEKTGFHFITEDDKKIPVYADLLKFFDLKMKHITLVPARSCYVYSGKYYESISSTEIENFAQNHFKPFAKSNMTKEFSNLVQRTNIKRSSWFEESSLRKMNFQNGVLDIDTMRFSLGHSPDIGFRSILNFNYDPAAKSPRFDTFMRDVTCADEALEMNLLEFLGYAISNDYCFADKILILTGEGSNGKTRFLNVSRALGGKGCISLSPTNLKDKFQRSLLDGALFCITEEMPAFKDKAYWEDMKGLASGTSLTADKKFKDAYEFVNKAKFLISCNVLPDGTTPTHGYFRKLLIIPFNQVFSAEKGNRIENIDQIIIQNEMPGVMNRVLDAYQRLRRQKYVFTESNSVKRALEAYKTDIDSVLRWFNENVHVLPLGQKSPVPPAGHTWLRQGPGLEYLAVVPEMYRAYFEWCEREGEKPVKATMFTRRIRVLIPECDKRMAERKIGGKKLNSISGATFFHEQHC